MRSAHPAVRSDQSLIAAERRLGAIRAIAEPAASRAKPARIVQIGLAPVKASVPTAPAAMTGEGLLYMVIKFRSTLAVKTSAGTRIVRDDEPAR